MKTITQPYLQAHCQSPTSQRYNQSFVKELAKPAPATAFEGGFGLPTLKKTK